jgi:hypothetical protein
MNARLIIAALFLLPFLGNSGTVYTAPSNTNAAAAVQLAWDPSLDPTCVGYNIYVGIASRQYTNFVTVTGLSNTSLTITPLVRGVIYYFTATAIYAGPLESAFVNEVSYATKLPAPPGSLHNPITLVVQSKAADPSAQWADAGMDWSLSADQANQLFRLAIVVPSLASGPAVQVIAPQAKALSALRKAMVSPPPAPN